MIARTATAPSLRLGIAQFFILFVKSQTEVSERKCDDNDDQYIVELHRYLLQKQSILPAIYPMPALEQEPDEANDRSEYPSDGKHSEELREREFPRV